MKTSSLLILLLLVLHTAQAEKYFAFSPSARQAYDQALSLRFAEAAFTLQRLKIQEPNNLIVHHIENYIDFFTVFISEDEAVYQKLKDRREERLDLIEKGDESSPYYLFVQADIRLQWALLRLKFEEYLGAFTDVSRAYKLLKRNQERFPDFMPNLKDLAILHAMVGTIPDSYRWGVKLLGGLDGTIRQGRQEIERVLAHARTDDDFIFALETEVLYAFLLLHLVNDEAGAWSVINEAGLQPESNPLHSFILANIALRTGHNDRAIKVLQNRPTSRAFLPFPYLDFMLGTAKLRRLDPDAGRYFQRFLQEFKGRNFIKEAYQKLAWQELINGNPQGYAQYMTLCREKGFDVAGEDKSAEKEAKSGEAPSLVLLKARLLFDGSYYRRALKLMAGYEKSDFGEFRHQLEFLYRMGRILHGLERQPEALSYYHQTIAMGKDQTHYYACNAALQAGLIYEKRKDFDNALKHFSTCLDLYPDEYRLGIHQKAKAGINRLR